MNNGNNEPWINLTSIYLTMKIILNIGFIWNLKYIGNLDRIRYRIHSALFEESNPFSSKQRTLPLRIISKPGLCGEMSLRSETCLSRDEILNLCPVVSFLTLYTVDDPCPAAITQQYPSFFFFLPPPHVNICSRSKDHLVRKFGNGKERDESKGSKERIELQICLW